MAFLFIFAVGAAFIVGLIVGYVHGSQTTADSMEDILDPTSDKKQAQFERDPLLQGLENIRLL